MGCTRTACEKCKGACRVWRDKEAEAAAWGPIEAPRTTITHNSYRTDEDDDGQVRSDNNLNTHKVRASNLTDV